MIIPRKATIVAICAVFTMSACAELQDPNNPNRNTQTGAIIGGTFGALTGILSGDNSRERRNRAILGGAIGAAGGAAIGNRLDQQEADLRAQLGNDQVQITNTGDRLIVTLPQDILFATDSDVVRPDLERDLRTVAGNLQAYPDSTIQIVGHTDADGDAGYNLDLSDRRANSVANILIGSGVPSARIQTFGRGESQPVASNLTPEGKAQNRRVEIVILPTAA